MVIVGASGSGKTALFYKLMTKEQRSTVSSTDVNKTHVDQPYTITIPDNAPQNDENTPSG